MTNKELKELYDMLDKRLSKIEDCIKQERESKIQESLNKYNLTMATIQDNFRLMNLVPFSEINIEP